jgi:tetratricopeptide (TPR) repeat protein
MKMCGTVRRGLILAGLAVFLFAPAGATLQNLQTGMKAPSFILKNLAGETRGLTDLAGAKLTVIIFWSTWSSKSAAALARMDRLYRQYRDHGLTVVAVNAEGLETSAQNVAAIKAMATKLNLAMPILTDSGLTTFHDYGVIALPSIVVLDREGIIRYELSGYPLVGAEELADYVATTLEGKKPSAATFSRTGHQPDAKALRLFNMASTALKSRQMASSAEEWLRKAAEADPAFALPWISLGRLHLQKGDATRAKGEFAEALSRDPANVIALCEMGMLLVNEGKVEEGKTLFTKALQLDSAYPLCLGNAGYVAGKTGHLDEGLSMFAEAAALAPRNSDIYLVKARMFEESGNRQEAAAAYRKALELLLELE